MHTGTHTRVRTDKKKRSNDQFTSAQITPLRYKVVGFEMVVIFIFLCMISVFNKVYENVHTRIVLTAAKEIPERWSEKTRCTSACHHQGVLSHSCVNESV